MIFDMQGLFSDKQAITTTAVSTNIIDRGAYGIPKHGKSPGFAYDLGKGFDPLLRVQVTTPFTAAGAATLVMELQGSVDEAFTSPVALWTSPAIPVASLIAGYVAIIDRFPRNTVHRYLRMNYTVATGPMTAGKLMAGLVAGNDEWFK